MLDKLKAKSNRAKFTIQKKIETEKSKPKVLKSSEPQAPIEAPAVLPSPEPLLPVEATVQAQTSVQPEPETTQALPVQPLDSALPANPFTMGIPSTPEHPFQTQETSSNVNAPPSPETNNPLSSSELSPILPKEEPIATTPVELERTGHGKGIIIYFIIVALVSFLIGIGSMAVFTFGLGKMKGAKINIPQIASKNTPTPNKEPTKVPSPTPTKPVDMATYKVKILNGSGVTGAASKLKTKLTTAGFQVVSSGNADRNDYTDSIVFIKKDIDAGYLTKLKNILKTEYSLASDSELPAEASKEADVIITIGINPAE